MATNITPRKGIRIPPESMCAFVAAAFEKVGMSIEHARLMGSLLVDSDVHGIFSHGSKRVSEYVDKMLDGRVNPRPDLQFVSERGAVRVLDGDGGLGHFACHHAAEWAVAAAKKNGIAAVATRNHHHVGSAGTFARLALEHDCIGMVVSSRRIVMDRKKSVRFAQSGGPIAVAIPADKQPPLVMDQGVNLPWHRGIFERYPKLYLKDLALGSVLQSLGGILAGIYRAELRAEDRMWAPDQGAFVAVFDVESFMPAEEFKREMDRYISSAHKMRPFPGFQRAELAGGPEWRSTQESQRLGIPVGPEHERILREVASRLEIDTPFDEFEHTRFAPGGWDGLPIVDFGRRIVRAARRRLFWIR